MGETYTDPINTPAKHTNGADALIEKTPVPLVQVNFGEDGAVQLGHGGDNPKAWRAQFNKVFGTEEWTFASNSLAQLIASLPKISNGAPHEASINASIAAVHSIAPEDELEAMLALQIVATHSAAMKMFDRAMMLEQPVEVVDVFLKHANKLL